MAPLMVIERHRRDTRTRKKHVRKRNCHYQGRVKGEHGSHVALSACNGLVSNTCSCMHFYFYSIRLSSHIHSVSDHQQRNSRRMFQIQICIYIRNDMIFSIDAIQNLARS